MADVRVILELAHTTRLERNVLAVAAGEAEALDSAAAPKLETLTVDAEFAPVALPVVGAGEHPDEELYDTLAAVTVDEALESSTYLIRGTVPETDLPALEAEAGKAKGVVGVYADVGIEPMLVCPGSPAVGTDSDVERLLCTKRLHGCRLDGSGVLVAIVDTGVNIAYLNSKGKTPTFDAGRSWAWNPAAVTPGSAPVGHGTMCAFDVCIAAPSCTILDIALLHSVSAAPGGTIMSGLLSDAIRAYSHLLGVMRAPRRPGECRSLVVNNSWGMFHPSWDFPVGHAGNYSDNPNHPFNRIVVTLARAGADILFAAGNCGADCPDGRCGSPPVTTRAIYGANSSPAVTCVAGVDTTKVRAGYSAIGPGRLSRRKPDISGYTHFRGSGVYPADGGTSAATPVVSGVVAAVRSGRPYDPTDSTTSPAAIRNLLTSTAEDLGPTGYDFRHGYGVVSGCALASKLRCVTRPVIDLCRRYPWLCGPRIDICKRYPWLCRGLPVPPPIPPIPPIREPVPPIPPIHGEGPAEELAELQGADPVLGMVAATAQADDLSPEEVAFLLGFAQGAAGDAVSPGPSSGRAGGCGCGGAG
ncbi:MAG: S8 family peptidase [Thermoleophilia bacterium]|nr:S8 family peptidase [Thermoleophilia bacterium]